ncbi:hypothetical protein GHT06_017108 [Daphnia sinensis]|uniref:Uncharacterized protein n=1 Tax=Daphnia sinensis TaxID=1820382 RepID=A0AAD5LGL6_9CRUS|nr:hypothetical protein GHT06_017108 [Daphnia sinensis]
MDKTRLDVMKILQASTSFTIILDIWSSKNMFGFIGFTCVCVNKEYEKRIVFLGVKRMVKRHTAENILAEYDQVLRDWNISRSKGVILGALRPGITKEHKELAWIKLVEALQQTCPDEPIHDIKATKKKFCNIKAIANSKIAEYNRSLTVSREGMNRMTEINVY